MNATPATPSPDHREVPPAAPGPGLGEPDERVLARSFRLCTAEGAAAQPIVLMSQPVNVVLAALFTKSLHLPNHTIGLISALPFVCNFLQLAVYSLLARIWPAKTISLVCAGLHTLAWVAFCVMLGFLPADQPGLSGLWIGCWFFASSFCASLMGVSWNAWVQEWVPARLRGKYFGLRNRVLQIASMSFVLLAGWILAVWEYSRPAFQLLIAFAAFTRLLSIIWQVRMPTEATAKPPARAATFSAQLITLRQNRPFILFISFGACWAFAANIFGPFYHVFMFEELGLSAFQVGLLAVCGSVGAALSMPGWGRLLDLFGNKGVMVVALLLWQMQNYAWCFMTPARTDWLYAMWLWGGLTNAGFFLGQFTLLLKLLPIPARNLALGLNLATTSLFASIAPILGGAILEWGLARWPALPVYHVCFLAQPTISLFVAWMLLRIREPAASTLTSVVGSMMNVRTLAGLSGLSFLANYIFYRNPTRRE